MANQIDVSKFLPYAIIGEQGAGARSGKFAMYAIVNSTTPPIPPGSSSRRFVAWLGPVVVAGG